MKRFHREVDTRDRRVMIAFLSGHERYDTMRSMNCSTSYANCVKLHKLGLTQDEEDRAWSMLDMPEVFAAVRLIMEQWSAGHEWQWQARQNGKHGGYVVLYRGGIDTKDPYTAECDVCGRLTWHTRNTPCTTEGCPGTLRVLDTPHRTIVTYIGQSVDQDADFAEWSTEDLRDRVRLVQDFDSLCDRVVDAFLRYCEKFRVVEKEAMVKERVKTLEPIPR